jgi:hypothetical protein
MELNNLQKNFISRIMEFISNINTYEDLSVEGHLGLMIMNPKIKDVSKDYYEAIDKHILRVKKRMAIK